MDKKKEVIIGTHNSLTAHPPLKWWMHIFKPFAVCQDKDIWHQYANGVRCFDIRVRLSKDGVWELAHGLYAMQGDIYTILYILKEKSEMNRDRCYVRLVLEEVTSSDAEAERFRLFCEKCDNFSEWITFFGGNRKCDWEQVYTFKYQPKVWQPVSSMATDARWYEKVLPKLYAKRMNNHNRWNIPTDVDMALFDYF